MKISTFIKSISAVFITIILTACSHSVRSDLNQEPLSMASGTTSGTTISADSTALTNSATPTKKFKRVIKRIVQPQSVPSPAVAVAGLSLPQIGTNSSAKFMNQTPTESGKALPAYGWFILLIIALTVGFSSAKNWIASKGRT